MGINQETRDLLSTLAKNIAKAFVEIRQRILEWIQENWKRFKEVAMKWHQLEEEKKVVARKYHKRDFGRQKMSHQVIDRKPQHLVRKIIRR